MTVGEVVTQGTALLKKAGIVTARLDTLVLVADALQQSKAWVLAHLDEPIKQTVRNQIQNNIQRRSQREPLAYIREVVEFYGLPIQITPAALIPRPESELLVESAIEHAPVNSRLHDIGTGSGALALAIKKHRPDLEVVGSDISPDALKIARRNAIHTMVDINFFQADLLNRQDAFQISDQPQTVVANLPYLDANTTRCSPETQFEPAKALYTSKGGLALYDRLFEQLKRVTHCTCLIIEAEPTQHAPLIQKGRQCSWHIIQQTGLCLTFQR